MTAMKHPKGVTAGAVLAYLEREADLDGLVTVSSIEVAAAIGIAQGVASMHLHSLIEAGLISSRGRTGGIRGHSISAYQLSEP